MDQWLGLCAPNTGVSGLIPDQGTRSHMLQLKLLHATTKTQDSQINIKKRKKETTYNTKNAKSSTKTLVLIQQ